MAYTKQQKERHESARKAISEMKYSQLLTASHDRLRRCGITRKKIIHYDDGKGIVGTAKADHSRRLGFQIGMFDSKPERGLVFKLVGANPSGKEGVLYDINGDSVGEQNQNNITKREYNYRCHVCGIKLISSEAEQHTGQLHQFCAYNARVESDKDQPLAVGVSNSGILKSANYHSKFKINDRQYIIEEEFKSIRQSKLMGHSSMRDGIVKAQKQKQDGAYIALTEKSGNEFLGIYKITEEKKRNKRTFLIEKKYKNQHRTITLKGEEGYNGYDANSDILYDRKGYRVGRKINDKNEVPQSLKSVGAARKI